MTVKQLVGKLHLWLGLASGLVVFVMGVTGAIFVFEQDLKDVLYKDRVYSNVQANASISLDSLHGLAQAKIGDGKPVNRVIIKNDNIKNYIFRTSKYNDGITWNYFDQIIYNYSIYANPYNGEIESIEDSKWEFFNIVQHAHMHLLLSSYIGKYITGVSTLLFLVILITGFFLWKPKNKKALKSRLLFGWRKSTGWKRKNYDLHNVLGFYSLIVLLVIALSGLMWSFEWYSDGMAKFLDTFDKGGNYEVSVNFDGLSDLKVNTPKQNVLTALKSEFPEAQEFIITFREKDSLIHTYTVITGLEKQVRQFDYDTGRLIRQENFDDFSLGRKFQFTKYDIHVGSALGKANKIIWFFVSLIAASLPVTGFLIWWGRRRKKARKQKIKKYPKLTLVSERKNSLTENNGVVYMNVRESNKNCSKN